MAVGGWLGGAIFDATLSYRSAFQAALAFNLLNLMLLGALLFSQRRRRGFLIPSTRSSIFMPRANVRRR
jgi:hypothetical protein